MPHLEAVANSQKPFLLSALCAVTMAPLPILAILSFLLTSFPKAISLPTELLHQFPPPTWVENLVLRPNGAILPITTTSTILNQLDPITGSLDLVYDFSAHGNAIQGITQLSADGEQDSYVLNVLTCNILTTLSCTPGSASTLLLRFCPDSDDVSVREIASLPHAGLPNGIATLAPSTILIADSLLGGIWSLSLALSTPKPAQPHLLFTDPAMNGTASIPTGINGLRLSSGRDTLFFTNSARGTFNRIPISPSTGQKTGDVEVLVNGLAGPDDLEVDEERGVAYVCNGALDRILEAPLHRGGESVVNATDLKVVAEVPGPTSVRWGRDGVLYASTIGGLQQWVEHNVTVGGAVYGIHV